MNKQTTAIYFFSGTGNSLFMARELAKKLDAKLVSIPAVMGQDSITPEADSVGIVFPVYYATNDAGGIPIIVTRFINKLSNIQTKYVFAVCTHGGTPGTTVENLKKALALRGGELAVGFTVKMSNHTLTPKKQQLETAVQQEKIVKIAKYVSAKKTGEYETRGKLGKLAAVPVLHLLIKPIFSKRFHGLSGVKKKRALP